LRLTRLPIATFLAAAGQITEKECGVRAGAAGVEARLYEKIWERLHPPQD
jgi:hypothetical protein